MLRVFILKPSSLGDVVQALPVLRLFKRHHPDSRVYWWIDSSLVALLEGDPDLAGVVPFERRRWAAPVQLKNLWDTIQWLRAQRFDLVIDLQCLARSGAIGWLANGELYIGLDEKREAARGFYDVIVPRKSYFMHAVDWYLGVLEVLGVPVSWDFDWFPPRVEVAAVVRAKWPEVANGKLIVLLPGGRWPTKRWPVANFAELIKGLSAEHPELHFAILGDGNDAQLGAALADVTPARCVDLTGKTTLPELVELIRLSTLVVSNDTGPMHIAAALGKPIVALFGPTEPRRTGPYGQLGNVLQARLECVPCMRAVCRLNRAPACMHALAPQIVAEKVHQLLRLAEPIRGA